MADIFEMYGEYYNLTHESDKSSEYYNKSFYINLKTRGTSNKKTLGAKTILERSQSYKDSPRHRKSFLEEPMTPSRSTFSPKNNSFN
mmetsp:Transcript_4235/g.3556  ORF Transcript_4235/g.3556 Transcript_4235/m.3556 type:complete len:87 (-) Transcript_4235:153-413(-)